MHRLIAYLKLYHSALLHANEKGWSVKMPVRCRILFRHPAVIDTRHQMLKDLSGVVVAGSVKTYGRSCAQDPIGDLCQVAWT